MFEINKNRLIGGAAPMQYQHILTEHHSYRDKFGNTDGLLNENSVDGLGSSTI